MSGVWSLLVLVGAVGAGLVTVTVTSVLVRERQTALFRYCLIQILLFNLLILGGLALQSVEAEFPQLGARAHGAVLPGLLAAMATLKLGWLYAFAAMTLVLPGQEPPPWFRRRVGKGLTIFFGVWAVALAAGVVASSPSAVLVTLSVMEVVVLGGATVASAHLTIRARSLPSGARRRAVAILGGIYLGIFIVMLVSLSVAWSRPAGQAPGHVFFNSALMVLYNLFPLVWILRFQPTGPISSAKAVQRYGITPRESEIIELVSAGRTNQEIADRLYISLPTVKDHIYNIFRKTGVRNRIELVNLMRERVQGR
jgi:DNA-binding CsgD family transcriptional regulator